MQLKLNNAMDVIMLGIKIALIDTKIVRKNFTQFVKLSDISQNKRPQKDIEGSAK